MHYFNFEKDFVEDGLRCIPMVVRMKLDAVGIKLTLRQWSQFDEDQRAVLGVMPVKCLADRKALDTFLTEQIAMSCDEPVKRMAVHSFPHWNDRETMPDMLIQQAAKFNTPISLEHWKSLRPLQRFALIKLSRPGHENRNFPLAMAEFGLLIEEELLCEETI